LKEIANIANYLTVTIYFQQWQKQISKNKALRDAQKKRDARLKTIESTENMGFVLVDKH